MLLEGLRLACLGSVTKPRGRGDLGKDSVQEPHRLVLYDLAWHL